MNSLYVTAKGNAKVCCWTTELISDGESAMSVNRSSLEQIWNSEYMRRTRESMIRGDRLAMCSYCDREESLCGESPRTRSNQFWVIRPGGGRPEALLDLARHSAADEFTAALPELLSVELGNLCNLACRMCSGEASSRIAADPVHSRWHGSPDLVKIESVEDGICVVNSGALYQSVLQSPQRLIMFYVIGGEPLINPLFEGVLEHFVKHDAARTVHLCFNTNATVVKPRVLELLREFPSMQILISLDGYGEIHEYLRYPARWTNIVKTADLLAGLPNARIQITPVLQVYNALRIVDLLRFCDERGWDFLISPLTGVDYIDLRVLPPEARKIAIQRLRDYVPSCRPQNLATVEAAILRLEEPPGSFDPRSMDVHAFNMFTNDLDMTRGQSFKKTEPELFDLLKRAGLKWDWKLRSPVASRA